MSSFTEPLTVTKVGERLWRVDREFVYCVGELGSNDRVTVEIGFITDFASVPQVFWSILPPDGQYTQAAVLHDWLYLKQTRTRKEADKIFLEAMEVLGVAWWKRNIMYQAVRLFAWIPWNKYKKQNLLKINAN